MKKNQSHLKWLASFKYFICPTYLATQFEPTQSDPTFSESNCSQVSKNLIQSLIQTFLFEKKSGNGTIDASRQSDSDSHFNCNDFINILD